MSTFTDAVFIEAEIRREILCDKCETDKLLLWPFASPSLAEKIAWASDHAPQDGRTCKYQVRCNYVHTVVAHYDKQISRGGFREHHGQ